MSERKVLESGTKGVGGGMWLRATLLLRWRFRVGWAFLEREGSRKDGRVEAVACRMIMAKIVGVGLEMRYLECTINCYFLDDALEIPNFRALLGTEINAKTYQASHRYW